MGRTLCFLVLVGLCFRGEATELQGLTDRLKALVEINSGTSNVEGVDRVQSWLRDELKQLGFETELRPDRLLLATLKGQDSRTLSILVHADTVFESSSAFQHFSLSADGKSATGPGIIDDKGGIVVALEGLKRFLSSHKPKHNLRFISSPAEEIGTPELAETFRTLSKDTWMVLGFEPSLEDGSIIQERRGGRWYHVTVEGKESHSGRAHKDGINACNELSNKIAAVSRLTDYKKDVTVSVGHMQGGQDKYNIVCGRAEAKIDTRFSSLADRDRLHEKIDQILKRVYVKGARTVYELADDSPPVMPSRESRPYVDRYVKAIAQVEGRNVVARKSLGGGDSNFFSRNGIMIIDGLGPTGGKIHTENEFLSVPSLDSRAEAFGLFLTELEQ